MTYLHLFNSMIRVLFSRSTSICLVSVLIGSVFVWAAQAQVDTPISQGEKPEPFVVEVAGGNIALTAPGHWERVTPRSNMLEAEIKVPKIEGDENDGRLTIMGAGGTIDANIVRWKGQFSQPDGGSSDAKTKIEEKEIAGQDVTLVQISGTFLDAPGGPFSGIPKVQRENYQMIAAIIETEKHGNYFVKLYGPKATIEKNVEPFKKMIDSLKMPE